MLTNRWTGTALLILAFFAVITLQTYRLETERRRAAILVDTLNAAEPMVASDTINSRYHFAIREEPYNIIFGNTLSADGLHGRHFDYMLQSAVRRGVEEDREGRAKESRAAAPRRF